MQGNDWLSAFFLVAVWGSISTRLVFPQLELPELDLRFARDNPN